ncbi:MAG: PEP-CTERM sorting domain-containing protein, partial [Thermoguttaceae bacterium]|nr:PEP-CTERM sorting domain-containing protein [Thermoguttaceae bacterium]
LYLDNSGEGVSLYMATGAFDSWNDDFALLAGAGAGFVNSYAAYLNGGGEGGSGVPEPSTWALLILGAAGMLYWRKRNA